MCRTFVRSGAAWHSKTGPNSPFLVSVMVLMIEPVGKSPKPGVQRQGPHLVPGEPTGCVGLVDGISDEHGVYIGNYGVEVPPATTVLNDNAVRSVVGGGAHLLLGFAACRRFWRLTEADRASWDAPRPTFIDPPGALLEKEPWFTAAWWQVAEQQAGRPLRSPMYVFCVTDKPAVH